MLCCDDPAALNHPAGGCPSTAAPAPWTCTYPLHGCPDPTADNYHFLFKLLPLPQPVSNTSKPHRFAAAVATLVHDYSVCMHGGCTDPAATNYRHNATYNDGTCIYPCAFACRPRAATTTRTVTTMPAVVMSSS